MRVDILEDDPAVRALIEHHLKKLSQEIEIRSYESIEEAIESIEESMPDLLLLDLHLDGSTGLKILDHFPMGKRDFPIVMMTSDTRIESADLILSHGADEMLHKPFDMMTLQGRVEKFLVLPGASVKLIHRKAGASMAVDFVLKAKCMALTDHGAEVLSTVSMNKGTFVKFQFAGQWLLSRVVDCTRDEASGYSKITLNWAETSSETALKQVRRFILQLRSRAA